MKKSVVLDSSTSIHSKRERTIMYAEWIRSMNTIMIVHLVIIAYIYGPTVSHNKHNSK